MDQLPWWMWVLVACFIGQWLSQGRARGLLEKLVLDLEIRVRKLQAHVGLAIDAKPPVTDDVKVLAQTPGSKIAAIKLYRQQTGAGLKEGQDAVERMARL